MDIYIKLKFQSYKYLTLCVCTDCCNIRLWVTGKNVDVAGKLLLNV